jgi:hypothetical protein
VSVADSVGVRRVVERLAHAQQSRTTLALTPGADHTHGRVP